MSVCVHDHCVAQRGSDGLLGLTFERVRSHVLLDLLAFHIPKKHTIGPGDLGLLTSCTWSAHPAYVLSDGLICLLDAAAELDPSSKAARVLGSTGNERRSK